MGDMELSFALHLKDTCVVSPLSSDARPSNFDVTSIYNNNQSPIKDSDAIFDDEVVVPETSNVPNMWSKEFVGVYCCYAIFGLLYGGSGTWLPFCEYVFKGSNLYHPFGYRRKIWMLLGAAITLFFTFLLAIIPTSALSANSWIAIQFVIQLGICFSDVPADGYSVELGQLESLERRGQILVTGQVIQFVFSIFAGVIQTLLLNGTTTNAPGCKIGTQCWNWGLTVNQYYGLMFCIIFVLSIPILFLRELDSKHIPHRSGQEFMKDLWSTMQNLTTMYLTIYVLGISMFTYVYSNVNLYLQYYIIQLSNFQVGIDTIATYLGLWFATWLFQKHLIRKNWRYTQYFTTLFQTVMGLLWIPAYYNSGGLRDAWYTIFIDLDASFSLGLTEILFAVAVIEIAKPGQEASTYEFLSTVLNNGWSFCLILSSQLLVPLKAGGCTDDLGDCNANTVDLSSTEKYEATNGPWKFTQYALVLNAMALAGVAIFTQYLPGTVEECHEWKRLGEKAGNSTTRGYVSLAILVVSFLYCLAGFVVLLIPSTACSPFVGGSGC